MFIIKWYTFSCPSSKMMGNAAACGPHQNEESERRDQSHLHFSWLSIHLRSSSSRRRRRSSEMNMKEKSSSMQKNDVMFTLSQVGLFSFDPVPCVDYYCYFPFLSKSVTFMTVDRSHAKQRRRRQHSFELRRIKRSRRKMVISIFFSLSTSVCLCVCL